MIKERILISGAGPVGMTIADILSSKGIPVVVVDQQDGPSTEWRASTFHAGTLELLESTGIVEELMKQGLIADKVQYRDRQEGLYAEFDMNLLKDETKYPFRLQCPQSTYVKIVNNRLKDRSNVEVRYSTEVVGFEQDENGVNVTLKTPNGEEKFRTPYLLGADGARSTIRKNLDVEFDGYTLEERFLLIGTPIDFTNYISDLSYVNYIADPEEFLFILRVPEAWRFLYPIPPHISDEQALEDSGVQKKIQKALNTTDTFPIIERMIYRIHQRVASKFYQGRVVLLGDAAHINSPMGGLGLNNGVHDAVDLSMRMVRILNEGVQAEPEFEKYSDTRKRVALEYVRIITEKNTAVMKEKDPNHRVELQKEYTEIANDPARAKEWLLRSSMIASVREQGIGEPPKTPAS